MNAVTTHTNMYALFNQRCLQLSRWLTLAALFVLPLYDPLSRQLVAGAAIAALLSGEWYRYLSELKKLKTISVALLLTAAFVIGTLYSQAPYHETLHGLFKYTKIIYCPLLVPIFRDATWRNHALTALLSGATIAVAISWHTYPLFKPIALLQTRDGGSGVNPISLSIIAAYSAFFLLHRILHSKTTWHILSVLAFCMIAFVYAVNHERTGMLALSCLLPLFCFQHFNWKGLFAGFVVVAAIFSTTYATVPTFQLLVHRNVQTVHNLLQGKTGQNSLSYRYAFAQDSLRMLEQSPLTGFGTGSFKYIYKKKNGLQIPHHQSPLGHPHNEFLMITFQTGVIGLSIFLLWLFVQTKETALLPIPEKHLAQGLLLGFIINSLCHVSLYTNASGLTYLVLLALFFGSALPQQQSRVQHA